jgi:hypothetical protein
MMSTDLNSVASISLPQQSGIARFYPSVNLSDAFSVFLPASASGDPEVLARFMFSQQPMWIIWLMKVRDTLVAGFGLKTSKYLTALSINEKAKRVGIFKVYSTSESEIVVGEDDKHLDFRVSVLCLPQALPASHRQLVVSTVVHCHNRLGRAYIFIIAPFHRMVVKASLRRAARTGWPSIVGS